MDPVTTTGIFAAATTAGGTLLGYSLNALSQRSASRSAARQQAQDLFVQIANAIGAMETERAVFRERRDSPRANFLAAGNAFLHALAGRAEGNWLKGAASGTSALAAWDAAEGARFTDRYQLAASEAMSALIRLSLISPALQKAASDVGDGLADTVKARKPRDLEAANKEVQKAIAGLRAAVRDYSEGKPKRRSEQKRTALPEGKRQVDGRI